MSNRFRNVESAVFVLLTIVIGILIIEQEDLSGGGCRRGVYLLMTFSMI